MSSERQHRREIVLFGRALHERGYVAAMDGNLSVRLDQRRILPVSTVQAGCYDIRDVALSVPTVVGRAGSQICPLIGSQTRG